MLIIAAYIHVPLAERASRIYHISLSPGQKEGWCLATAMDSFTFLVNTQHNPPAKGSHAQAINAHCATIGHRRRIGKRVTSEFVTPPVGRRTLILKVSTSGARNIPLISSRRRTRMGMEKPRWNLLIPDFSRKIQSYDDGYVQLAHDFSPCLIFVLMRTASILSFIQFSIPSVPRH